MSRQRNNTSTNTPFSNYLYNFNGSTKVVMTIHNLDYMIVNYQLKKIMLIEEKRFNSELTYPQVEAFKIINGFMSTGNFDGYEYCGFHQLIFENTLPTDGKMTWDNVPIDEEKLTEILDFKANKVWYETLPKFRKL